MIESKGRVWTISDLALIEMFERIEEGELTASDAIAVLEEHAIVDAPPLEEE
jgi:hypothetical protein